VRIESTRLRFISSPSPEGLESVLNSLPFKVELKNISKDGKRWIAWFVLPDIISHDHFNRVMQVIELKMRQSTQLKAVQNE
jgi:hypothetical protein